MKDRIKWQKEFYSKFWQSQVNKYGFDDYCKNLYELILTKSPSNAFELAIGTGWPFAINLHQKGINISGCDIAEFLIDDLKKHYPDITAYVSSYDQLIQIEKNKYDLVYCLRSTWYFPDLFKAIDSMFFITKQNGCFIFDIMNKDSKYIKRIIWLHRFSLPYTISKNVIKLILNKFFRSNFLLQNIFNIQEIPVSLISVEEYLKSRNIKFKKYFTGDIIKDPDWIHRNRIKNDSKIIFECYA